MSFPRGGVRNSLVTQLTVGVVSLGLLALVVAWGMPFVDSMGQLSGEFRQRASSVLSGVRPSEAWGSWRLVGADFYHRGLKIELGNGRESLIEYFLPQDTTRPAGGVVGRWFRRFMPVLPIEQRVEFEAASAEIAEALEAVCGDSSPWETETVLSNFPGRVYSLAFFALLAALVVFGISDIKGRGTSGSSLGQKGMRQSAAALAAGGLAAGGFLFRHFFSLHAPLHSNLHGIEELDHLLLPLESPYPSYVGRCHEGIVDAVFMFLPRSLHAFWIVTALVGALTALAGVAATSRLFGSRAAGWFTGVFIAFSPHLARVSTSESLFLWGSTLLLTSLWGLSRWLDFQLDASSVAVPVGPWRIEADDSGRKSRWSRLLQTRSTNLSAILAFAVGSVALFLLVQIHLTTVLFSFLPLAFLLVVPKSSWRRVIGPLAWLTCANVILAVPHVWAQWAVNIKDAVGSEWSTTETLLGPFTRRDLALNPSTAPVLTVFLSVAGLVLIWLKDRRKALFLTCGLVMLIPLFASRVCFSDLVRYQACWVLFLLLPAGFAAADLTSRFSAGWRRTAARGTVGLLLLASLPGPLAALSEPDAEAAEFLFLREQLPTLAPGATLVVVPGVSDYRATGYFSRVLLAEAGNSLSLLDSSSFVSTGFASASELKPLYFYKGLIWFWLEAALDDPGGADVSPAGVLKVVKTLDDAKIAKERIGSRSIASRTIAVRDSPVSGVPRDFNRLVGKEIVLELFATQNF